MEKNDPIVITPLIRNRPRLRFVEDAGEGAAGDDHDEVDESQDTESEAEPNEGEESLGDAGKKALDAMKAKMRAAQKQARDAQAEVARIQAESAAKDKPAEEQALDEARREATAAATAAANQRLVKVELRSAAKGKLANPADALVFIDPADFTVGDDGEIDSEALDDAIDALLTERPYLAADTRKFGGGADQGAKGKQSKPSQLTREQLQTMTPAQIIQAEKDGRLDQLKGITR